MKKIFLLTFAGILFMGLNSMAQATHQRMVETKELTEMAAKKYLDNIFKDKLKLEFSEEQEKSLLEVSIKHRLELLKIREKYSAESDSILFYTNLLYSKTDTAFTKILTKEQNKIYTEYLLSERSNTIWYQACSKYFFLIKKIGVGYDQKQCVQFAKVFSEHLTKKIENWRKHNYKLGEALLAFDREQDKAELAKLKKLLTEEQYKAYIAQ